MPLGIDPKETIVRCLRATRTPMPVVSAVTLSQLEIVRVCIASTASQSMRRAQLINPTQIAQCQAPADPPARAFFGGASAAALARCCLTHAAICTRVGLHVCVCVCVCMLLRQLTAARDETFAPGPPATLSTTVNHLFTSAVQHIKVVGRQWLR